MKNILVISALLFSTFTAFADCAGSGIYFWPQTPTIKQNSIIVIECYAQSQKIISELNSTYPIYLKSGDNKIKLNVSEICVGQFYLTQAILVPEEKLQAGLDYELCIDNLEGKETFTKWNSTTKKHEAIKWQVEEGTDTEKPTWTKKPDLQKKTYVPFGCGPAVNVHFNFAVYDESPFLLRATVTNVETSTKSTYYLNLNKGTEVLIGHNMCSGAFKFDEGKQYEISFDIVDYSGNTTAWAYNNILFTAPLLSDFDGY